MDDWCRLAARMGQKTCDHFYTQEIFPLVFESAIAATRLDHRDASASVYKFLIQEHSCKISLEYLKGFTCL